MQVAQGIVLVNPGRLCGQHLRRASNARRRTYVYQCREDDKILLVDVQIIASFSTSKKLEQSAQSTDERYEGAQLDPEHACDERGQGSYLDQQKCGEHLGGFGRAR